MSRRPFRVPAAGAVLTAAALRRHKVAERIFALTVKKSTPEFARKRFYDLLDVYSQLCSSLGRPFRGDLDAVSDEGDGGSGGEAAPEEDDGARRLSSVWSSA